MNQILKKLGLTDQSPILILNAPLEYKAVMDEIQCEIHTGVKAKYSFIQIFALTMREAESLVNDAIKAFDGDGRIWLCYPKGTSKKYKSDINRNKTWDLFAPFEFEPVTQVAIDDDWSAMRFRHVDNIKNMTRKTAATEKGKERIKGGE